MSKKKVDNALEAIEREAETESARAREKRIAEFVNRFYYLVSGKMSRYVFLNDKNHYLEQTISEVQRRFKIAGIQTTVSEGASYSPADMFLTDIQDNRRVDYLGALAGHKVGLYEHSSGSKFLINSEAKLIEPREGSSPLLDQIIKGLTGKNTPFDNRGLQQWHVLNAWIRRSYLAIRDSNISTAQQALVLAGAKGAGKSLCAEIIKRLLGGRGADAHRYMLKNNDFNSDLCEKEILLLDDKSSCSKISERRRLASQLKTHTVATGDISLHGKGRDAVSVSLLWRIIICVNDNAEALTVLPPLDEDVADKMILLKAHTFEIPWDTTEDGEREKFMSALTAEMPHYLHWLLNDYEMPEEFKDSRYGVASYHHPEIAEKLNRQSPEYHLLEMIDKVLWKNEPFKPTTEKWHGTASELKELLMNDFKVKSSASRILEPWEDSTGTYLGRLASKKPNRVVNARTSAKRGWIIYPPKKE